MAPVTEVRLPITCPQCSAPAILLEADVPQDTLTAHCETPACLFELEDPITDITTPAMIDLLRTLRGDAAAALATTLLYASAA